MKLAKKKALACLLAVMMVFGSMTEISVMAQTDGTMDAVGAAGDSFATAAEMQLGETYDVSVEAEGNVYYKFTPEESGSYSFSVKGDWMSLYLHDEDLSYLDEDWGNDFALSYDLEGGKTYYLNLSEEDGETAKFKVSVKKEMLALSYQSDYEVNYGDTQTMQVSAQSGRGPVSYQWYQYQRVEDEYGDYDYEYQIIPGATQSSYTVTADETASKRYQCIVTDGIENKTAKIYLTVQVINISSSCPYSVERGELATMSVQAESLLGKTLTYQWYHKETAEDEDGEEYEAYVLIPGAEDNSYQVTATQDLDSYKCEISDGTETESEYFTIHIKTHIIVTGQTKYYVKAGEFVTFWVKANSSEGSLTYQWRKRNEGEYTYTEIDGADSASYTVRATEGTTSYYQCAISCKISSGTSSRTETVYEQFEFQIIPSTEKEIDRIVPGEGWPTTFAYEEVKKNDRHTNFTYSKPLIVKYKDGTEKTVNYGYCCWLEFDFSSESSSRAYISYMGKTVSYDVSMIKMSEAGTEISLGEKISGQAGAGAAGRTYYSVLIPANGKYVIQISDLSGEGKETLYSGMTETDFHGCYEPDNTRATKQIYFSVESVGMQPVSYSVQVDTVQNISQSISDSEVMQDCGYYRVAAEQSGYYEVIHTGYNRGEEIATLYNAELEKLCSFYNQSTKYYFQAGEEYYIKNEYSGAKLQMTEAKSFSEGTKAGMEERITWNLTTDGTLTIEGEGDMPDNRYPWRKSLYETDQTIQKVSIEEGITGISSHAFYYCSELKEIKLPDSLSYIGIHAFRSCEKLQTVMLPENLTEIKAWAFGNCTNLTEITIPENVKEIGLAAFYGCSSLNNVNVAGSRHFDYVGEYAFDGTAWANGQGDFVILGDTLLDYVGNAEEISIPDSVQQIGVRGLAGSTVTKITLNSHISKIWEYGFSGCQNLKEIRIPGSVTDIAYQAFSGCTALEQAVLNQGVKNIEYNAFEGCSSLKNLSMEEGLEQIGTRAFLNNSSLKDVKIPKSVNEIGAYAFGYAGTYQWDSGWKVSKETGFSALRCYPDSTAHQYAKANSLSFILLDETGNPLENQPGMGENQTNNQPGAGGNQTGSTSSKIGETYTVKDYMYEIIGNETAAFAGLNNKNSKKVSIPSQVTIHDKQYTVTEVADEALQETNVKTVTMPASIQSIGTKAFYNCKKLTKIAIPSNVGKIGNQAFGNCKKLKNITVKTAKLTSNSIGKKAFKGIYKKATIKVPKNKLKLYKKIFRKKGAGAKVKYKK